ncbi:MAG: hypothetical protein AB7O86_12300 [Porticoccaceae bacterium]
MKWVDRIGVWCSDYREIFHAILAVIILAWAVRYAPMMDPRVSFDGWSDLLYLLTRAAQGFAIVLFAWMSKTATHGELTDAEDDALRESIKTGDMGAARMYSLDMLSTAFWACLWAWIVLGAH